MRKLTLPIRVQFGADEPKLLLVGIIEDTCLKTVVREIPGISDVFFTKDDGKDRTPKVHIFFTLLSFDIKHLNMKRILCQ